VVEANKDNVSQGAYIFAEADGGKPDIALLATGSEVSLAIKARELLAADDIKARVVSMPCWELFDAQPKSYRESVLPSDVPRLSIEAGVTLAWAHYLDENCNSGKAIGLDRFGASAPYKVLFEQFGFTAEKVVEVAKLILK
jgi:transketolase